MFNAFREVRDFLSLMDESNNDRIRIAFYSERDAHFQYFEPYLEALVARKGPDVHYITSDPKDRLLRAARPGLKAYYINNSLAVLMKQLRARVVVMTMPDLGVYHIKRSPNVGNYVYVFHAVSPWLDGYSFNAFDHYDTIFCVGPHNVTEFRLTEKLYQRKPKRLVECGYPRLDSIHRQHRDQSPETPYILAASTWGDVCLLNRCPEGIVEALSRVPYPCGIRPHPEFIKREPKKVKKISGLVARHPNLSLDLAPAADLRNAEVLIADSSGIGYEYALATERPVLFLREYDSRFEHSRYDELGLERPDVRAEFGRIITIEDLPQLPTLLAELQANRAEWRSRIISWRSKYVFNWLRSAEVGVEVLLELCRI